MVEIGIGYKLRKAFVEDGGKLIEISFDDLTGFCRSDRFHDSVSQWNDSVLKNGKEQTIIKGVNRFVKGACLV